MKYLKISVVSVCVFVAILYLIRLLIQYKIKITTKIDTQNGIESLERIRLGDLEQYILIRGKDNSKPVLLWLDGGPGEPLISYARDMGYETGLEEKFVMVYWDQRGVGKSYSSKISKDTMTIEQYVSDIHELTQKLKERFDVPKIYLLGRSWGTIIGTLSVAKYPNDYYAYIGVGQVAYSKGAEKISYQKVLDIARKRNNKEAIKELEEIGMPPYNSEEVRKERKWVINFEGFSKSGLNFTTHILKRILVSPEYSIKDIINVALHGHFALNCLWEEANWTNFFKTVPKIEVPVYFLEGKYDFTVPWETAQKYYKFLKAPKGKDFIIFENSAHTVPNDEPDKFYDVIVNKVLNETNKSK
ncbi:alpha/beta fold hydrolase [Sporohalobacter salinus]|uniref:alpha/beta fold hydrolase n=1 Tax=Sporohalobacter salinus TaxID=1494606 RepID=UPI0019614D82|nr:alpha/beta hydrolase [Sporohalobacter salinus]MBM7624264.1 pimeloyl-ACP methyl ester carboxylesterase [Sporohalobacter salinus]